MIYSLQGEAVLWARFIKVRVVYTYSPFSTFLWDNHLVGKPFRIFYLSDKACSQKIVYLLLNNLMMMRVEMPYLLSNRFRRGNNVQFMRG